jgi:hypothetical protein
MLMEADSSAAQAWFIADFVPEILDLVLETWEAFHRSPSVRLEQRLTNLFSDALERAYEEQNKQWFVVPDMKRTDPKTGKELARHDIRFFHRGISGQRLYFIFECKRLNVLNKRGRICANSSAYEAGVLKFVNQTYGAGHPAGGMIGYVMDGDVPSALKAVLRRMQKNRSLLRVVDGGDYAPSRLMAGHPNNGETIHHRNSGRFVIYHVLLPCAVAKQRRKVLSPNPLVDCK